MKFECGVLGAKFWMNGRWHFSCAMVDAYRAPRSGRAGFQVEFGTSVIKIHAWSKLVWIDCGPKMFVAPYLILGGRWFHLRILPSVWSLMYEQWNYPPFDHTQSCAIGGHFGPVQLMWTRPPCHGDARPEL
jgi:hypothetical protein